MPGTHQARRATGNGPLGWLVLRGARPSLSFVLALFRSAVVLELSDYLPRKFADYFHPRLLRILPT